LGALDRQHNDAHPVHLPKRTSSLSFFLSAFLFLPFPFFFALCALLLMLHKKSLKENLFLFARRRPSVWENLGKKKEHGKVLHTFLLANFGKLSNFGPILVQFWPNFARLGAKMRPIPSKFPQIPANFRAIFVKCNAQALL